MGSVFLRWLASLHRSITELQNHVASVCEGFGESSSKWGMAACVKKHMILPTKQQQREQQEQQCFTSSFFHYYACNAMNHEVPRSPKFTNTKKYPLIFRTHLQSYIQERKFVLFLNEILAAEVKKTPLPLRRREKTKLNHLQDTHLELIATRIIKMDNMDAIKAQMLFGKSRLW